MPQTPIPERVDVDDARVAAVFQSPRQRRILLALIPEPRALSQLVRLTDTPLNLLHHHVAKFIRMGLVSLVREERRAGAPIKFYRAAASSFFVPGELMAQPSGAGMAAELRRLLDRSFAASVTGVVFSHDDQGPRMRPVRDPAFRSRAAELWLDLRLSDADAAELTDALKDVLHRFEPRSRPDQPRFLVHAAIAAV